MQRNETADSINAIFKSYRFRTKPMVGPEFIRKIIWRTFRLSCSHGLKYATADEELKMKQRLQHLRGALCANFDNSAITVNGLLDPTLTFEQLVEKMTIQEALTV